MFEEGFACRVATGLGSACPVLPINYVLVYPAFEIGTWAQDQSCGLEVLKNDLHKFFFFFFFFVNSSFYFQDEEDVKAMARLFADMGDSYVELIATGIYPYEYAAPFVRTSGAHLPHVKNPN